MAETPLVDHQENPEQVEPAFDRRQYWKNVFIWSVLALAAIAYAWLTASQISRAYVDFGDGNYLYIASRIADPDGLIPYLDIMAPQPPAHLLLGSWVLRLGGKIGSELLLIRWLSILIRVGVAFVVASIARWACRSIWPAIAAGGMYLFLPVGFIWSLGYQSEPLEILFLALMVRFILPMKAWSLIVAAIFGVLAAFTNMTALPYAVVVILWLIWRRGWLALAFIIPFIALKTLGILGMELWTDGNYLDNVFFNQVGTYPKEGLIGYVAGKIYREGLDVVVQEGFPLALSLLGIGYCLLRNQRDSLEFLALFACFSLGSITFVSKGGTVDYIFTIGEPYVAIFTGCLFAWVYRRPPVLQEKLFKFNLTIAAMALASSVLVMIWRELSNIRNFSGGAGWLVGAQLIAEPILFLFFLGMLIEKIRVKHERRILIMSSGALASLAALAVIGWHSSLVLRMQVFEGLTYQLPPERVEQVARLINQYSNPRDKLISPPWFAFDTHRLLAGEYSETFIWTVGYANEQQQNRELGMPPNDFDGPFTRKTLEVASGLEQQDIPIVILDNEQTGMIPEIKRPLYGNALYPLLDVKDLLDPAQFVKSLADPKNSVSRRILTLLPPELTEYLKTPENLLNPDLLPGLIGLINERVILQPVPNRRQANAEFYFGQPDAFASIQWSKRTQEMLKSRMSKADLREYYRSTGIEPYQGMTDDLMRLNRRLLVEAYPGMIRLMPEGAKYQELTELTFDTRDTPLRFFIPADDPKEPVAATLDELVPLPGSGLPPTTKAATSPAR